MRLKSIQLVGFKSFVDPTTVSFATNMTGIVGPNGCGKSNVIDAVRWVMGESSAKYLRGEAMTDVIFNGSRHRQPVGQASIELVFDNSAGQHGGAYAAYAEIAVKRVVTREAQSTYLLNGSKCRRRDITDLFLGTGLGPRSYAIIEQGMIARLIEAKPEELRVYLEEAAGLSKYKERRRETHNRMRRTEENLERLDDVREELGRQLERLGRQAEAAQRYQSLKASERRYKAELAVLRWREADQQLTGLAEQLAEYQLQQEASLAHLRHSEAQLEARREEHLQSSEALEQAQKHLADTRLAVARLEQGLQHRQERLQELEADWTQLLQEEATAQEALQADQTTQAQLDEQLEETEPLLDELTEMEALEQEQLETMEETLQQQEQAWSDFLAVAEKDQKQATWAQAQIQQQEHSLQSLRQRLEKLGDPGQQEEAAQQLHVRLEDLALDMAALDEQLAELDEQEARQLQEGDAAQEALHLLRQTQDEQATQLQQTQGRLASLEALQQAAMDNEDAVLEDWLEQQNLAHWPRLGEVLEVTSGWEKAVEACLETQLAARLAPASCPAATLEALSGLPSGYLQVYQSGPSEPIACAPESLLPSITHPRPLPRSLEQHLATIKRAPDWATAWAKRGQLAAGERWVTPEGQQVFADGIQVKASGASDTGVLARQQSIRTLQEKRALLEACCEESEAEEARYQTQWQSCQVQLQALTQARKPLQNQRATLERDEVRLQTQQRHLQERSEQLSEERQLLIAERETALEALQAAREDWQQALLQVEDNSEARDRLAQQRDQLRARREDQRQQLKQRQAQAQRLRLQHQQLHTQKSALAQALVRLEQQQGARQKKKQQLENALAEAREPGEMQSEVLEEKLALYQQQENRVQTLRNEQQQAQAAQRHLEQDCRQQEKEQGQLRTHIEEARLQQQKRSVQRDTHLETLKELELTLKEVLVTLPEDALESRWQAALEETQARIKRLGAINLAAIEEYDQQRERKTYLDAQHQELMEALDTLSQAINRIDRETRLRFKATFEQVNAGLQALFPRVFGGGTAWLQLTGDDLLETGVTIMARPPGKKNATIHLLSGGEKALTALALVFSIFELNPAPFCMLDEVDAPLDDANVGRYARLVKEMSQRIQFIYITHNKQAMESADQLMGVTMQEPGVSRLVSVDLQEASAMVAD